MRLREKLAFTLIELLTVMAITAIMMTLIIIPVVQSFNLMRAGQGFSDAQHKANQLVERIGREIAQAAAVRDNSGFRGMMAVYVPGQNRYSLLPNAPAPALERILIPFAKIDLLMPAEGEPIVGPSGALINPTTGREDPTLKAPKGQIVLPVSQGSTLVRYFIGRRNPFAGYNNPYDGLLMQRNGLQDNLYVLYRVEVQPWIFGDHDQNAGTPNQFYVNNKYFFDLNRDNDPTTSGPLFDDPDFMEPGVALPGYAVTRTDDPAKAQMVQNWLNKATVMTEYSRYDMIQAVFNKANRQVTYLDPSGNENPAGNIPRIYSLLQFRPSTVSSEPADGLTAVRLGDESEGMASFGPDVFRTKMGSWSNVLARFWPDNWQNLPTPHYEILRPDPNGVAPGLSVYIYDPASGQPDTSGGTEVFDADEYMRSVRYGLAYPFSRAAAAANLRSGWLTNTALRDAFVPYYADAGVGKLIGSFDIGEYGSGPVIDPFAPFANMNVQHMNTGPALTPTNDPGTPGAIGDPEYAPSNGGGTGWQTAYPGGGSSINRNFNKVWFDNPGIRPEVHRFIDLRVGTLRDGSPSPLNPDASLGFRRASIVPGSEIVIGPDQNPGPNYGNLVRYTRTTRTPGPNQYRINYTDLPEPTDYSLIGFANPPANYDPNNFVSAIIQPRYKAGYVQFNSDPNVPLPEDNALTPNVNEGNISVFYRFQMTEKGDAVAVDYDTGQLIQVLLTIKNFPQTTIPNPQTVTLKATATVRNVLR